MTIESPSCAAAVHPKTMGPLTRDIATVALGPLELLVGRGGDVFDRDAPRSALLRNGVVGCVGNTLAVGAVVAGTGLCVGLHVLTHPLSFSRRSVMRVAEMGALTVGGLGYDGVNSAFGVLLGAARYPVSRLRAAVERANNMLPIG